MFEYNKRFWARMFENDDEPEEPNTTYYAAGIVTGLIVGALAGWLLNCLVPMAALGGSLGMWIGNKIPVKKK